MGTNARKSCMLSLDEAYGLEWTTVIKSVRLGSYIRDAKSVPGTRFVKCKRKEIFALQLKMVEIIPGRTPLGFILGLYLKQWFQDVTWKREKCVCWLMQYTAHTTKLTNWQSNRLQKYKNNGTVSRPLSNLSVPVHAIDFLVPDGCNKLHIEMNGVLENLAGRIEQSPNMTWLLSKFIQAVIVDERVRVIIKNMRITEKVLLVKFYKQIIVFISSLFYFVVSDVCRCN